MPSRRTFLIWALAQGAFSVLIDPFFNKGRKLWAAAARWVVPKDTPIKSLVGRNPAELDPRELPVNRIEEFGTMGQTDVVTDPAAWRLKLDGLVGKPLEWDLDQVKAAPAVTRKVLLICPGVFAYTAEWTGVLVKDLLERAEPDRTAAFVMIQGPEAPRTEKKVYSMAEVVEGKILLAYQVNGQPLPRRHGFPLRVVAEGRYGFDWVKYAYRMTVLDKEPG